MAEALVAAELAEHTVEASIIGGYALAQPTLPLKARIDRIATTPDPSDVTLKRIGHTVCVLDNNAYIFGGETSDGKLAGNEVHIIRIPPPVGVKKIVEQEWDYKCIPAIAKMGEGGPEPRKGHSAVAFGKEMYVFGGKGDALLEEKGKVWVFDTTSLKWSVVGTKSHEYPACHSHGAAIHKSGMIIHGGQSSTTQASTETWRFDIVQETWHKLPDITMPSSVNSTSVTVLPNVAVAHDTLYLLTGSSELSSEMHTLDLSSSSSIWQTISFPTNTLTPGPRPRKGAGLSHIAIGQGREYLLYFLGEKTDTTEQTPTTLPNTSPEEKATHFSDFWVYQLASDNTTSASLKDMIRDKLGAATHQGEWSEVEIVPNEEGAKLESEGKSHPGPRTGFGYAAIGADTGGYGVKTGEKASRVFFWGGRDPRGDVLGDGWLVDLSL